MKICREQIGGLNHVLLPRNKVLNHQDIKDNSIVAYGLARVDDLLPVKQNDLRTLSLHEFHIERFFLHATLYLACGDQNQNHQVKKLLLQIANKTNFLFFNLPSKVFNFIFQGGIHYFWISP